MSYVVIALRTLLGLGFTVLGLDYFLHFMPPQKMEMTPAVEHLMAAFGPTGYMHVVKVLEVAGGVLLLTGFLVPLGLVLLMPVIVNIALFDLLLMQKAGLGIPLLAVAVFLIWAYRRYFTPLFTVHAKPF